MFGSQTKIDKMKHQYAWDANSDKTNSIILYRKSPSLASKTLEVRGNSIFEVQKPSCSTQVINDNGRT